MLGPLLAVVAGAVRLTVAAVLSTTTTNGWLGALVNPDAVAVAVKE
jgi:hypothetical protein